MFRYDNALTDRAPKRDEQASLTQASPIVLEPSTNFTTSCRRKHDPATTAVLQVFSNAAHRQ